ncbi:nucleoside diphosphate kinase regulator [Acinetobacter sichuanensis]|uniref:Nucleoside diphosphate kinase regulator n=1 Tax=Acinetobacter sichuanensis TaxID=2136183 RepID=A0A371YRG7_9GAMM|nr:MULTISPECIES: nucleoside diphosphate kinase regulator [Acinetobacter]MDM1246308.1 nucleoside diphosphate kinase regulator [Acinetobacter sp. R933-2]MDM1762979.1 nucleoside diphosphate kinase regulator [Acinetobacter sp. 226-1]MDM1766458.1 nucleoside diphosphate kinase regulator [Acinetobacter sp. 226-4]MDQ9019985.1 nucleoside diphosphate kinase regulator [Acinetobacter sichuanensis]RFC84053.1 nucleoside diphosphate kinase regulator [Acinetobacter sichuanensis]
MAQPNIIISEQDLHRLETMLENQAKLTPTMEHLEEELARAEVVTPQDIPTNIVTMNAKVLITIAPAKEATEITLVYPHDFRGEKGQVNVVAPIGAAILGLAEGQEIEWPQPDGHTMKVKIEKVIYQPEREGDFL